MLLFPRLLVVLHHLIHYADSALVIVIKDGGSRGTERC